MIKKTTVGVLGGALLVGALMGGTIHANPTLLSTLGAVSPTPQSVGILTFGPENILFVGDTKGAAVFALDVADMGHGSSAPLEMDGVDRKIAAMLGVGAADLLINDMAVHPASQNAYLSVMRGRGEGAIPLLIRVTGSGEVEEVAFEGMNYSMIELSNSPGPDQRYGRRAAARQYSITDMAFVDGQVLVAGLSNEEFASNMRRIPFPFADRQSSTSLQIYHVSHGQTETHAPVMTFMPREIGGETHILAAYTCTPLVQFEAENLTDGQHVIGKTIAELGAGNRPLDIISYAVGHEERILISNSRHPLMKVNPSDMTGAKSLEDPTKETGMGFETIDAPGIRQMDNLNAGYVLLLQQQGSDGPMNLRSLKKSAL